MSRNNSSVTISGNWRFPVLCIKNRRLRERIILISIFVIFCILFCSTFFYLPESRTGAGTTDSVYNEFYDHVKKVGPDLLIPAPPHNVSLYDGVRDNFKKMVNVHAARDRQEFMQRVEQEEMNQRVLEKPDVNLQPVWPVSEAGLQQNGKVINISFISSVITVPASKIGRYPLTFGGEDSDPVMQKRRQKIVEMMNHAWGSYAKYAWGMNELKPISKTAHTHGIFGTSQTGATIVDSLDTLYIMEMYDEFRKGRDWVAENLDFDKFNIEISVFETNIRYIGGLLSCYALTGDTVFRDKAEYIANKLLPAFDTPTGIPHSLINLKAGITKNYGWASAGSSILSELGTLHLEFVYLSEVSGNPIFREKVMHIRNLLRDMEKPNGLYPNFINEKTGKWAQHHMSMGGLGDSFYEYLLKAWVQSGQKDFIAKEMFDEAMAAMIKYMLQTSPGGLLYISDMKFDKIEYKMDALACFAGGLFGLAAHTSSKPSLVDMYMKIGEGIANTCHEAYIRSDTKLAPESFKFSNGVEAKAIKSSVKYYILRPETVESYFVLWRLTKNPKYREWGWEVVQALEKHCKVDGGYSGIRNVYMLEPSRDDVQQSYFLAEMLKYLYLLYSDDKLISLDEWVFNSEAHPLPIKGMNAFYRPYIGNESKIGN